MSTIADQLKELGLGKVVTEPEPKAKEKKRSKLSSRPRRDDGRGEPTSHHDMGLELPRFGTVARIDQERGFGFLSSGRGEEVFFHIKGLCNRSPDSTSLPAPGTEVLFITGSDPRRTDRQGAVRWMPATALAPTAAEPPGDQASLDVLRRDRLLALPWEALWGVLGANWYVSLWKGRGTAPVDLEDPVLERVLVERLSTLEPGALQEERVRKGLGGARYPFAPRLLPDDPQCAPERLLAIFQSRQLAALGAPQAVWMRSANVPTRARLLEWYVLSRAKFSPRGDWQPWFTGGSASEADLATQLLEGGITVDPFISQWLGRLTGKRLLDRSQAARWAERWPDLAATLFELLPAPRQLLLLSAWRRDPASLDQVLENDPDRARSLLASAALAVDLETDGERIWEVGCARNGAAELLHDERSGTELKSAMQALGREIGTAPLLIGHNLLAWDWPIVSKFLGPAVAPVIWDTLLVQFMLVPHAGSHALGGKHHADEDALTAARLFEEQLGRLPASIARGVLSGEFADTTQLLDAVAEALQKAPPFAVRPKEQLPVDSDRLTLVPEDRLHGFDWVEGVRVVSADPALVLAAPWREIDVASLENALAGFNETGWAARVVLAVVKRASEQNVPVRRNMIPAWLAEGDAGLTSAIEIACRVPPRDQGGAVASIPTSIDWWVKTDPATYSVVGFNHDVMVVDRQPLAPGDVEQSTRPKFAGSLTRTDDGGPVPRWLLADRAAHVLSPRGGLIAFRTLPLPDGARKPTNREQPLAHRPVLATRQNHVLHPGAHDQASYWSEVLRTFKEVATWDEGQVPILLIGSSASGELIDLLATGLAELGLGEVKPVYRSQREHLLRASRQRHAIVDTVDRWSSWHGLAQLSNLNLQPVVEALPVEEWFACAETTAVRADGSSLASDAGLEEASSSAEGFAVINAAAVLDRLPTLVRSRLLGWMGDVGLAESATAAVLIDPRVGVVGKGLARLCDLRPLNEAPFEPEQARRVADVLAPFKLVREDAPAGYDAMEQFLVANWQSGEGAGRHGVTGFKPSQRAAMEAICERAAHVLVSLPTGEGKSVLFQVPALCRGLRNRRLTLVLSPLKALMRDQVERLHKQGFAESADYLSSDRSEGEVAEVIQGILDHRIVLLYVAPERLRNRVFLDVLDKRMQADGGLEHVVVDEAHCVNQWGFEFRPDYFHALAVLLEKCRTAERATATPFLLLSATVTASDRARLETILSGAPTEQPVLPLLRRPESFSNPLRSHIGVEARRVRGNLYSEKEFNNALAERLPMIKQAIDEAQRNRTKTGQRSAVIVFVNSRSHAERVAQQLVRAVECQVDYYHAGLDGGTREEIYTRFLDGELDVLVATKAFGMGMDIPDIHWIVHLSPPSYLEDYLQEVGRIGRGAKERERAELSKLSALLLFSDADFEHVRSMRARHALSFPAVQSTYQQIRQNAYMVEGGRVAIVPYEGYETAKRAGAKAPAARRAEATRVRMALYWLERAERLRLCGSVPDLVTVAVYPEVLQRLATQEDELGEVAKLILQVEDSGSIGNDGSAARSGNMDWTPPGDSHASGDGLLDGAFQMMGRLFSSLASSVGLTLSGPETSSPSGMNAGAGRPGGSSPSYGAHSSKVVVLNLSQIRYRSGKLKAVSDVLASLSDLEKGGALLMKREVQVAPRRLAKEGVEKTTALFDYVDGAVAELIRRLSATDRLDFTPEELVENFEALNTAEELRRPYKRAFINGFRHLARASGVKLRQTVQAGEAVLWHAVLPEAKLRDADVRRTHIRRGAQALFGVCLSKQSVPLSGLIDSVRSNSSSRRFRTADLKATAGLLSAMNLMSISSELVPLSHVVALSGDAAELDGENALWQELNGVNDFAEARTLAMELFANLPSEAHSTFIEGYFAAPGARELRAYLEKQLGEIGRDGTEDVSSILADLQEKLRATKVQEFFDVLKGSEEPAQWEVVSKPYDRHLLVNAGPGAGKTFVLVGRIAHLIREQRIDPSEIVVLAFNRAVVFEIRRRIRALFKSLGYAAYASRLRVATFHSFAISHLARIDGFEMTKPTMSEVLAVFADRMRNDSAFRQQVAGGVRSILIDEFQDATDNVYSIIHWLHAGSGSRAGIMAIGDDDQDILRWQRKKDGSVYEFSEQYFDRFVRSFGGEHVDRLVLGVNFRSGQAVVDRSQAFLADFFDRNRQSRRLKDSRLVPSRLAPQASWSRLDWRGRSWADAVQETAGILRSYATEPHESIAILCRSNADVAEAHRQLVAVRPDLQIQGGPDLRVADLRHVALWLDHLRRVAREDDRELGHGCWHELFEAFATTTKIPEVLHPETSDIALKGLWELCRQERAFPHLSTFIRFAEEMRTDDLLRLTGVDKPRAVVSTLHKVKGLEFDNVIILPSTMPFGGKGAGADDDLASDAAEEARLLYVGMTRAKRHLSFFIGDREYHWAKRVPSCFAGEAMDGSVLVGSMEDIALGWAMQRNAFNSDPEASQRYIESEVAVGDEILLGGVGGGSFKALMHRNGSGRMTQVGFLAKKHGVGGPQASLKVSAVVRFQPDTLDDSIAECVRARGWGYAVLVSGRLR